MIFAIIVPIFCFDLGQHTLEAGTVAVRAGAAIIHKEYRVREWFFLAYSRRIAFWERDLSRINSPKQHWLST